MFKENDKSFTSMLMLSTSWLIFISSIWKYIWLYILLNFNQKRAKVAISNFQEDVNDINLDENFPLRIINACVMHVFKVFLCISFYEFTLGIKQSIAILNYCLSILLFIILYSNWNSIIVIGYKAENKYNLILLIYLKC